MRDRPLLQILPDPSAIPFVALADLPTPVERLTAIERAERCGPLWVKRDDLSGALYGGNKVRKLEFALGEALACGARSVYTLGAIGSHHVLATALYARKLGLEPRAQHFPQPVTEHVRKNLLALSTTRPTLRLLPHPAVVPFAIFQDKLAAWMARDERAYFIPGGGSSALGTLGYVSAALELADQIDQGLCPEPDTIVVAAGTVGTLAGLLLGRALARRSWRVIGARVVEAVVTHRPAVLAQATQAARLLRRAGLDAPAVRPAQVELDHAQIGAGYGHPTPAGDRAVRLASDLAPFELDPTYTGKAFASALAHARAHPTQTTLYWHTLSGADLSSRIARANPTRDLPAPYHPFFSP